jgi:ankyrin repeat protein
MKSRPNNNELRILTAIEGGNTDSIDQLLQSGLDPSEQDAQGNTALMSAARQGLTVAIATLLLHSPHLINMTNHDDKTAFMIAKENKHRDAAALLQAISLGNNQGLDAVFEKIDKPTLNLLLYKAVVYNHLPACRLLIRKGANVNIDLHANGWTPLMRAAFKGHAKIAQLLLSNGADPAFANEEGRTPLQVAAMLGHVAIIQLLFKHSTWTNINKTYQLAKEKKHAPIIQAFEDYFKAGQALINAAKKGDLGEVQKQLDEGVFAGTPNRNGSTALHKAAAKGLHETAELLISKQADVNSINNFGWTPLMSAARYGGDIRMMQHLINEQTQIDNRSKAGWTALMIAARYRDENIVAFLITQGAAINATNKNDWSPVMLAACARNKKNVSVLFKAGATIDLPVITKKINAYNQEILFQWLLDNIKENIHSLFSGTLTAEQFSSLLADTNTKTGYLTDQAHVRKLVREEIILCLKKTKGTLDGLNDRNELLSLQNRMQTLADQLAIIQKTENHSGEKTAKIALLGLIADISKKTDAAPIQLQEKSRDLFNTLLNLQRFNVEKTITNYLLKEPDEEEREALQFFLSTLNNGVRDQIKQTLFKVIKTLADEPKMEKHIDPSAPKLTIDRIKAQFDEKAKPILFDILRAHKSGATDRDTGTWKTFVQVMKDGNFNRTALVKGSLFGFLEKNRQARSAGRELVERNSPKPT